MTIQQIIFFSGIELIFLAVVTVLARPTARRMAGALAGGAAMGVVALVIIALGEKARLWHMVINWQLYYLFLMWIGFAVCGWVFLVTWRTARRFGWRGLAAAVIVAAVIGPPRDRWYMARYPEWGYYAPGIAPVLAISASYVLLGFVGHGVMRLIAGPARGSPLIRWPWEN